MKRIHLLLLVFMAGIFLACTIINTQPTEVNFTETDLYKSQWQKVEQLQKEGLPKSAKEEVEKILLEVRSKDDLDQIIRCYLYIAKYTQELNEEGQKKGIQFLENQLTNAEGAEKALLYSILAGGYTQYLNSSRWKINQRTELAASKEDILTWTTNQFIEKSKEYHLKALSDGEWLKLPISDIEFILTKGRSTEGLRPTLFDFLAHRAIDHFSNTNNLITEPTNTFLLNDENVFGSTKDFLAIKFEAENESSGVYQALLILQKLAGHHQELGNSKALFDVERKRLTFAKNHAVLANKETLFVNRLQQFINENDKELNMGDFLYEIVKHHFDKANGSAYDYESRVPAAMSKARSKAQECIKKYSNSWGAEQCKNILIQIDQKELHIQVEQAIPIKEDFLVGLTFKNLHNFHVKLIASDDNLTKKLNQSNTKESIAVLNRSTALKSWPISLDYEEDYYQHRTEFPVEGLSPGKYIIVVSEKETLKENEFYKRIEFRVTNLSMITMSQRENPLELIVVHRNSGEAISGAKVEQWIQKRSRGILSNSKVSEKYSDNNGKVSFQLAKNSSYFYKVYKGEDYFSPQERFYGYRYNDGSRTSETVTFFQDRKIYRPGQTIYFKGIALSFDRDRKPAVLPNKKYEVIFKDANRQEIAKQTLRTNEFGSFQGSFIAPEGGLLGRFSIQTADGNTAFNIEEYKRPKFEVEFESPTSETALNETIEITGKAMAFAGYPIDQAQVSYRVTRQAFFPWCPWWRIPSYYNRAKAEIENGKLSIDENGKFTVSFIAKPDQTILEADQPEYQYVVTADVTDGTGETRSSSFSIRAGVIGFNLSHDLKPTMKQSDLKEIKVSSKNLNGEFVEVEVTAQVFKLDKPQEIFKERYYQMPDIYLLGRSEFKKRFPRLAYQEESKPHTWKEEKEIWKQSWKTEKSESKNISKLSWSPGTYKLILTGTDKFGKKAETESIIEVYNAESSSSPGTNWVWSNFVDKNYKVGELFEFPLVAKEKTNIYYQFYRNNEVLAAGWETIDLKKKITKRIDSADKGNFFLSTIYVKENRFFLEQKTISVPWSDKILKIETSTFRDKLKPGDDETWSFKISGEDKDKFAAEVLATMYDASLDAFKSNSFGMNVWPTNFARKNARGFGFNNANDRGNYPRVNYYQPKINRSFPGLNSFGLYWGEQVLFHAESTRTLSKRGNARNAEMSAPMSAPSGMSDTMLAFDAVVEESFESEDADGNAAGNWSAEKTSQGDMPPKDPVRSNLNETVFFLPQLQSDADGNLSFSFKMNEALTSWKLMLQAHDQELRTGTLTKEIVTQKELMVVPNPPRFFREGDLIEFTAKVVNLTDQPLNGDVKLSLANAMSEESINHLIDGDNSLPINLAANASTSVSWKVNIPKSYLPAITHKVVARAGKFSDGEQEDRVVLTNRLMVTETFPMPVRANEKKTFDFSRIEEVQRSSTATPHQYSVEFTSNPAWYAVLALPYLMEYPYDCTEQNFSRYYANTIAAGIANKYPKIQTVFKKWENTDALLSNLSKNEDLKSALLEETPWVLQSQSEEQQRKNIGLLFNLEKLGREQQKAINKLKNRQEADGGFAWFKGGRSNRYITEYILTGFKRLEKMGFANSNSVEQLLSKGLKFIDQSFAQDFKKLKERLHRNDQKLDPKKQYVSSSTIHYLFARSFFNEDIPSNTKEAYDFYQRQIEQFWMNFGLQNQAQIALIMNRTDRRENAMGIIKSFRERALHHDELGMYWKVNRGYFWYNNELETHAFMINCLQEIDPAQRELEDLQTWLLKNKQTNAWETTKSTALAIYALLMTGENAGASLANSELVDISLGNEPLTIANAEAGTGYFRTNFDGDEIPSNASSVTINNPNDGIAWGASYFQYFEDMDKVTHFEETPLQIKKEVFLEEMTEAGPVLKSLQEVNLKPGNRLKVRMEIRVDRAMEFVHLKDQRASGLEPENVLSQYKYQGNLGYYESTKDASTNFFISYLPKGTHVFEYPLRVVHAGDFSNGITTIQSMYAPEFSSHSEGVRIVVEGSQ